MINLSRYDKASQWQVKVPITKVLFVRPSDSCGMCESRDHFVPHIKGEKAILFEDSSYVVTVADSVKRDKLTYPAPGYSKTLIIWLKGSHDLNFVDMGFKYYTLDLFLQQNVGKLPWIPKKYGLHFHIDSNTWNHPHFRLTDADIRWYPKIGNYQFDEISNDYIFKMLRTIMFIYNAKKRNTDIGLSGTLDTVLPLREMSRRARPGILDIQSSCLIASAIEWTRYLMYDYRMPISLYLAIEHELKENPNYTDILEIIWKAWMKARSCLEYDVEFMKLIRHTAFPKLKNDKETGNRFMLQKNIADMLDVPCNLCFVPISVNEGPKRVPRGVVRLTRGYGLEVIKHLLKEKDLTKDEKRKLLIEFFNDYTDFKDAEKYDDYDLVGIAFNLEALKMDPKVLLVKPPATVATQTE